LDGFSRRSFFISLLKRMRLVAELAVAGEHVLGTNAAKKVEREQGDVSPTIPCRPSLRHRTERQCAGGNRVERFNLDGFSRRSFFKSLKKRMRLVAELAVAGPNSSSYSAAMKLLRT
jgi:hypothetical protein